jgi:hypothetical protein
MLDGVLGEWGIGVMGGWGDGMEPFGQMLNAGGGENASLHEFCSYCSIVYFFLFAAGAKN